MTDKIFANGIWGNNPHENAPDFVVGKVAILKERFAEWLAGMDADDKGYVKLDVTQRKDGSGWSFALDTYVKPEENEPF